MPQSYRIAPALRRCCWYCIAASLIVPALVPVVALTMEEERRAPGIIGAALLGGALFGYCALCLYWRLEITDAGIIRRRWLGREALTWDDFASGEIRKQPPFVFVDPHRPWWRRKLDLGLLCRDDRRQAMEAINLRYQMPPAPALPDSLTIRYRFNREATFDAAGIRHTAGGATNAHAWDQVRHVLIERHDAQRRDFRTLDIELADPPATIDLWMHGTNPNWCGATAEELNAFVLRNVSQERIEIAIDGDYAMSPRLAEKRRAALQKRDKDSFWMLVPLMAVFVVATLILVVVEGIVKGLLTAALICGFWSVLVVALYFFTKRDVREQLKQFDKHAVRSG